MSFTPGNPPSGGIGALLSIGPTLQNIAQNIIKAVTELQQLMPAFSSGQLSADTLVFTGFVRVTGLSVTAVNPSPGYLHDAANINDAAAGNQIYQVPNAIGYIATQMIFEDGLVYKAAAGEKLTIFYVRS